MLPRHSDPRKTPSTKEPTRPTTTGLVPTGQRGPEGSASLEEENQHLKARLAKAVEVFRQQEAKYAQLAQAYEEERKARLYQQSQAQSAFESWQRNRQKVLDLEDQLTRAGIEPRPNYQWAERGPTLDDVLQALLALAHPDHWSQGQPATALAHELAIKINALRREGRHA
jgi:hypothetical protein